MKAGTADDGAEDSGGHPPEGEGTEGFRADLEEEVGPPVNDDHVTVPRALIAGIIRQLQEVVAK